ncbi:MAG: hypothetical protein V4735_08370 [Pseudomonadota bacterium]
MTTPEEKTRLAADGPAAVQRAIAALKKNPLEALKNYPYPGTTEPDVGKYFAATYTDPTDLRKQRFGKDDLRKEYRNAALDNLDNAKTAFAPLARHYDRRAHTKQHAAVGGYKKTSGSFEILMAIARKYSLAADAAIHEAERQEKPLSLPQEVIHLLHKKTVDTIKELDSFDAQRVSAALASYPPGRQTKGEWEAYRRAAVKSGANAEVAIEALARHWAAKPEDKKQDRTYQETSHSHAILMLIASRQPQVVVAYAHPDQLPEAVVKRAAWIRKGSAGAHGDLMAAAAIMREEERVATGGAPLGGQAGMRAEGEPGPAIRNPVLCDPVRMTGPDYFAPNAYSDSANHKLAFVPVGKLTEQPSTSAPDDGFQIGDQPLVGKPTKPTPSPSEAGFLIGDGVLAPKPTGLLPWGDRVQLPPKAIKPLGRHEEREATKPPSARTPGGK